MTRDADPPDARSARPSPICRHRRPLSAFGVLIHTDNILNNSNNADGYLGIRVRRARCTFDVRSNVVPEVRRSRDIRPGRRDW